MDLTLSRKMKRDDGIFGELPAGSFFLVTLEHAFSPPPNPDGSVNLKFIPKIAEGRYLCKRSMHRLHNMTKDFETFQVMDVPPFMGHPVTNILFHWGNYNSNSDGCILLGKQFGARDPSGKMITDSENAWKQFMQIQAGIDTFWLTIQD